MLVLSRKKDEVICIGPGISINVLNVQGGKVRLGIDAPAEVRILRAELQACINSDAEDSTLDAYLEATH